MNDHESWGEVLREVSQLLRISRPLTVLDVETTGTSTTHDRVVQIACMTVPVDGEPYQYEQLINPTVPIPPDVTAVHGITDQDVANQPTFSDIAEKLRKGLQGHDYVAYKFRFDKGMLESEFKRSGVDSPFRNASWIDPLRLWQHLEPRTLSDALERFYGTRPDDAHRADVDIDSTARVLVGQLRQHGNTNGLEMSVPALSNICSPRHPAWIDSEGKIVWKDGAPCLNFGKHKGISLQSVDKGYLEWMLTKDFGQDLQTIIRKALTGVYPEVPDANS